MVKLIFFLFGELARWFFLYFCWFIVPTCVEKWSWSTIIRKASFITKFFLSNSEISWGTGTHRQIFCIPFLFRECYLPYLTFQIRFKKIYELQVKSPQENLETTKKIVIFFIFPLLSVMQPALLFPQGICCSAFKVKLADPAGWPPIKTMLESRANTEFGNTCSSKNGIR